MTRKFWWVLRARLPRAVLGWCRRTMFLLTGRQHRRPARMLRQEPAILRLVGPFALILLAATIVLTGLGFVLARQADDHLQAEQRSSLANAIAALQRDSSNVTELAPRQIEYLAQVSGL